MLGLDSIADSNGRILSDPSDPSIYNPIKPENRYLDNNNNGFQDAGEQNISVSEDYSISMTILHLR